MTRVRGMTMAVAALLVASAPALAQPRASQHGAVSQEVHTTSITLEYDRPVLRGRSIFGQLLDYDQLWTPGANRTTWIDFNRPVTVQGVEVPEGRYGLWTRPRENGPWQIILVEEWDTHHSYFPHESRAIELESLPEEGTHMEVLAYYFPVVGPYSTTLRLHWGTMVVPLEIEVGR